MDEVSQKMLGLALGGGAYRGVAHLGVLKAFEEEGLKPGFLSGTSSGGLAAAFTRSGCLWKKSVICQINSTGFT